MPPARPRRYAGRDTITSNLAPPVKSENAGVKPKKLIINPANKGPTTMANPTIVIPSNPKTVRICIGLAPLLRRRATSPRLSSIDNADNVTT